MAVLLKPSLLISPFIGGCTLVFLAWVMPRFLSPNMLGIASILISVVAGYIVSLSTWYRDSILSREVRQSPEPAETVWAECKRKGTPYAVYLRSFNYERLQNPVPIPIVRPGHGGSARRVELRLVKKLRSRLPILALADPEYPFSMPGAHRFISLPMPWRMFIEQLLLDAPLIIVYIAEYNPGLAFEISLVGELGLADKTLVIEGAGGFNPLPDCKWVVDDKDPHLEDILAEIVESLDSTRRKMFQDDPASVTSFSGWPEVSRGYSQQRLDWLDEEDAKYLLKAAQVFSFLLPLIIAFKIWGAPGILDSRYWRFNKSMREIRKSQENSRRATDILNRRATEIQKFQDRIRNLNDNRKDY